MSNNPKKPFDIGKNMLEAVGYLFLLLLAVTMTKCVEKRDALRHDVMMAEEEQR